MLIHVIQYHGPATGSTAGLSAPAGIALDVAGRLYVANWCANSITVYSAGATGNASPVTALSHLQKRTAAGRLYVANSFGNSITVYAAGATGNVSPVATIAGSNTGLSGPWSMTF